MAGRIVVYGEKHAVQTCEWGLSKHVFSTCLVEQRLHRSD